MERDGLTCLYCFLRQDPAKFFSVALKLLLVAARRFEQESQAL